MNHALERTPPAAAATLLHARGGVRVLLKDFKGAIADYDETLRLDPSDYVAYISRGSARYHRRDPRGVSDYVTAFSLNPEGAARELARVLGEGAAHAEEVLANCDQHLRISERDTLAHARRGFTLVLLGREEEAALHLARVRSVVPGIAAQLDRLAELIRELPRMQNMNKAYP